MASVQRCHSVVKTYERRNGSVGYVGHYIKSIAYDVYAYLLFLLFVSEKGTEEVQAQKVIRGEGKLFMPGFTDSHMHTGQQLLKGLVLDAKPIIWTRVMLPFESTLTPEK